MSKILNLFKQNSHQNGILGQQIVNEKYFENQLFFDLKLLKYIKKKGNADVDET